MPGGWYESLSSALKRPCYYYRNFQYTQKSPLKACAEFRTPVCVFIGFVPHDTLIFPCNEKLQGNFTELWGLWGHSREQKLICKFTGREGGKHAGYTRKDVETLKLHRNHRDRGELSRFLAWWHRLSKYSRTFNYSYPPITVLLYSQVASRLLLS